MAGPVPPLPPTAQKKEKKDRVLKCKTCMGMLIVKNSSNEVPVCYGVTSEKELKVQDLKAGANKLHSYQFEKSSEKKITSIYFGNSFWTGLAKKTPQGVQKNIIVNPTTAVVVRMQREETPMAAPNQNPIANKGEQQQQPKQLLSASDLRKELSNSADASNVLATTLMLTLQKNATACQNALTVEKYSAFYGKFCASASSLGSNLTTNFVPRFTDAGTKVMGACIKVGYTTYDKLYNILTK